MMKHALLPPSLRMRPCGATALLLFANGGAFAASVDVPVQAAPTQLAQVEFNDSFLRGPGEGHVDISRFNNGNPAIPGTYRIDLYVNAVWLGRTEVTLKQIGSDKSNVQACFDRALLERAGVDIAKLSPDATAKITQTAGAECATLPELIADATASFDNGEQRLDVSVPQASMNRQARGYVDPRYWDDGVPAALLQYNANVYQSQGNGSSSTQGYLGLNAGFNMGPWRFRHNGNLTSGTGTGTHYQDVQTSLQRSITPLKSELTLGEGFTDGSVFDSFGFRGAQLATDDMMYPESQRGYAPTVRGIANSNALVQITQNGNIIYETNVAPGPFVISDLYPTGYGGNLTVTVTEADGSKSSFQVPYASAVSSLRAGLTRYSVTAGQYRSQLVNSTPLLFQGTVQHGFTNTVTGYAGFIGSEGYIAGLIGASLNTNFGAVSLEGLS